MRLQLIIYTGLNIGLFQGFNCTEEKMFYLYIVNPIGFLSRCFNSVNIAKTVLVADYQILSDYQTLLKMGVFGLTVRRLSSKMEFCRRFTTGKFQFLVYFSLKKCFKENVICSASQFCQKLYFSLSVEIVIFT